MTARHALPLHVQISEMLIRDIQAGRLLDGERLPPERAMAQGLGISVGTLRKALADLADKGLLMRVQGSGNYVQVQRDVASVYSFFRVELLGGGGLPTAELLSVTPMDKPSDLPEFGTSAQAFRIRRLRHLSGTPAVLEEIWLDGAYAPEIPDRDLLESLYLYYRQRLGLWITRAEDRLTLGTVPDWAPETFAPRAGAASVLVERCAYAQNGVRAEVSRSWIDSGVATYVSRLA